MDNTAEAEAAQDIKTLVKAFKEINQVIDIKSLTNGGNMQMIILKLPGIIRKIQREEVNFIFLPEVLNILQKPQYNEF